MLDFIGIGVSRSGTTWIWDQLKTHPQVCTPGTKETHIFESNNITQKLKKYQKYQKCSKNYFVGEYTPRYFFYQQTIAKIKKHSPSAKLLLILRNPLERIFTQYKAAQWKHYKGIGDSFLDWFNMGDHCHISEATETNKYMENLPTWYDNFGEQLKITLYDDLVNDPLGYIQGVFKHIGIRKNFVPPKWQEREKKKYNVYFNKHPIQISKKEKNIVRKYFKKSILDLQDYLGRDLSHWLEK